MFIIFSFCLNWGSLCFMPVFHIAAMLIMCSVSNRCSLRKLYTHQFQGNTKKYINSAHRILQITEVEVKQLITAFTVHAS